MALNASGPISLGGSTSGESIALELGLGATAQISLNDSAVRTLAGKASGDIIMPTDFYAKLLASVTSDVTTVSEGGTVTFTLNAPGYTTVYWTILPVTGTVDASDFTAGNINGSVALTSGSGTLALAIKADVTTEGSETFKLEMRKDSITGAVLTTSGTITISDTSTAPGYTVIPGVSSVNEGGSVSWVVTTTNITDGTTLYWVNTGTASGADFSDGQNSGSFTVTGNTATISRTLTNDSTTEGSETIILEIKTGSISGTTVATSSTVTVADTSINPGYSISPGASSVNEGGSVSWTVTTTNVADGTTLYWTNSGTTTGSDFSDGQNSGSFTVTSNTGTISRTLTNDAATEGSETIVMQVRTGSTAGTIQATSSSVTVADTSLTAGYAFTTTPTSINEGASGSFTVTTTNFPSGTLYWTINTNAGDFGTSSGSFTISGSTGTFSVAPTADVTTEGAETFTVSIRTGSTSGPVVATSSSVTINDTSLSKGASITTPGSINEGASGTFSVTTTSITSGTTLYWNIIHGTTAAADFSAVSGSFVTSGTSGSFSVTCTADMTTEGAQTFTVEVREGSAGGNLLGTSGSVTINDTSVTRTATFSAPATSINEGITQSYTVSLAGVTTGTTLYWTIAHGTTAAADFSAVSGSFVTSGTTGSFSITTVADKATEGNQTFTLQVRVDSTAGTVIGTSATITLLDTSTVTGQFIVGALSLNAQTTGTWTVPAGVTSVSVVCIGGGGGGVYFGTNGTSGGGGGGGGGGTTYRNAIAVTAGEVLSYAVGGGGSKKATSSTGNGGFATTFSRGATVLVGSSGGSGGNGALVASPYGGGAGGSVNSTGSTGYGTGGSGTAGSSTTGGNGGNGAPYSGTGTAGGNVGASALGTSPGGGTLYGVGGKGGTASTTATDGGAGALRVMWNGTYRQYPATGVADQ